MSVRALPDCISRHGKTCPKCEHCHPMVVLNWMKREQVDQWCTLTSASWVYIQHEQLPHVTTAVPSSPHMTVPLKDESERVLPQLGCLFFRYFVRAMRKVVNTLSYLNELNIIIYGANTLGSYRGECNISHMSLKIFPSWVRKQDWHLRWSQ